MLSRPPRKMEAKLPQGLQSNRRSRTRRMRWLNKREMRTKLKISTLKELKKLL
jgi:hypothetical protein